MKSSVTIVPANSVSNAAISARLPRIARALSWSVMLVLALLGGMISHAEAAPGDTYWTSTDGVTIWARLAGWDGSHFILITNGRDYRVPAGRLAPSSVAKARQMLDLPVEKPARPARPTKPAELAKPIIAARPAVKPVSEAATMTVSMQRTSPALPEGTVADYLTPELPVAAEAEDRSSDPCASVLPDRTEILPEVPAMLPPIQPGPEIRLDGRRAIAPAGTPSTVLTAIEAGNRLQTKYYKWGGGRARLEDSGYDCSGSVSYVLIKAGLLRSPLTSGSFTRYGAPGRGRWITIYARNGHVFMTICGLRLDTGGHGGRGESGPRWCTNLRGTSGFVARHPHGL